MTTEQTPPEEVSASEDVSAAEVAEKILSAGEAPPAEERQPERPQPPSFDPDELVARIERSVQGRTANTFGKFRSEVRAEIEAALAPVREFTTRIEQAQVEQMEPEQQVEYWRQKAQATPAAPAPKQGPQAEQQGQYTPQEQQEISASVSGMLDIADLDIPITDSRLWEGYQPGDSPARIKQIARQNIRKMQGGAAKPAAATPPAPESPPVAPSTSGAPRRSATTLTTRSDAYRAFNEGTLKNSTELNKALAAIKAEGKHVL